jgi:hypothetical protein
MSTNKLELDHEKEIEKVEDFSDDEKEEEDGMPLYAPNTPNGGKTNTLKSEIQTMYGLPERYEDYIRFLCNKELIGLSDKDPKVIKLKTPKSFRAREISQRSWLITTLKILNVIATFEPFRTSYVLPQFFEGEKLEILTKIFEAQGYTIYNIKGKYSNEENQSVISWITEDILAPIPNECYYWGMTKCKKEVKIPSVFRCGHCQCDDHFQTMCEQARKGKTNFTTGQVSNDKHYYLLLIF